MPHVTFAAIRPGRTYSRHTLADLWGYSSFHAIARGVVTPAGDNKIVIFVTENKKSDREQYLDRKVGNTLHWEGPTDHFAEDRMRPDGRQGDEVHGFYRRNANDDFTYLGVLTVIDYRQFTDRPSSFSFSIAR